MARKILSWALIILGGLFLITSIVGIGAIWVYNKPLTDKVTTQLTDIDGQLAQAEVTLQSSEKELDRALRIVDSAQTAMDELAQQTHSAGNLLDTIQTTLDDNLLPELKTTRNRIASARTTLQQLQSLLSGVGGFVPGLDLTAPDKILKDLISSTNSLDAEITNVEALGKQASLFVGDTSFLLGGDLTSTQASLRSFLAAIRDYEEKVADWRGQVKMLLEGSPKWIDQASIALTIFLLWFGLSQFGLILHGLNLQQSRDPFLVLRRTKVNVRTDGIVEETYETAEQKNDSLT